MILTVSALTAGYGQRIVVRDVSLNVGAGEIVTLLGPNGSGKSTIVNAICGVISTLSGTIEFDGVSLGRLRTDARVALGISVVPQWTRVFAGLSVIENLRVGGFRLSREELDRRIVDVRGLFPFLTGRLEHDASTLSGGEQQMLALARALIPSPRLLVVDEPSIGLAPQMVQRFFENIRSVSLLKGLSVLLVEQRARDALAISHRAYGLKFGEICFSGAAADLMQDEVRLEQILV